MSDIMRQSTWRKRGLNLLGAIGVLAIAFEIYTRFPANPDVVPLDIPADATEVVLLFHGTGGRDEPILLDVAAQFAQAATNRPGAAVRHYVWSPWSDNRLRASANGEAIGVALGLDLASRENLQFVRLIAHSAGAYLLDPLCETYRKTAAVPAHIEMTFVDAMGLKGGWDFGWGERHYGHCADYAAAYINTDDPVPSTNTPLRMSYNIDTTNGAARENFVGKLHVWPVQYLLDHLDDSELKPGVRTHDEQPRGQVVQSH